MTGANLFSSLVAAAASSSNGNPTAGNMVSGQLNNPLGIYGTASAASVLQQSGMAAHPLLQQQQQQQNPAFVSQSSMPNRIS